MLQSLLKPTSNVNGSIKEKRNIDVPYRFIVENRVPSKVKLKSSFVLNCVGETNVCAPEDTFKRLRVSPCKETSQKCTHNHDSNVRVRERSRRFQQWKERIREDERRKVAIEKTSAGDATK